MQKGDGMKQRKKLCRADRRLIVTFLSSVMLAGSLGVMRLAASFQNVRADAANIPQPDIQQEEPQDAALITPDNRSEDIRVANIAAETPAEEKNLLYENTPITQFRVSEISPQVVTQLDYTDWWYCDWEDTHYLFLPATADRTKLVISAQAGGKTVALNGTAVTTGKKTDLLSTADVFDVTAGGTDCGKLHIMQSNLPVVYWTTATGGLDYKDKNKSKTETGSMLALTAAGTVEYNGIIEEIDSHGNSSWDYSIKKPYNVKLPEKAKLYGMGKAKKWVFLGNNIDDSMIRNTVSDMMARQGGLTYTMDSAYVDLYCDGSYRGTYQIYEKVQVQKHRVAITDLEEATEAVNAKALKEYTEKAAGSADAAVKEYITDTYRYYDIPNNPADITGGYLLQFQLYNRYKTSKSDYSGFVTKRGQAIQICGPKYATKKQVEYIRSFVQDLEDAIYSPTGKNAKGKSYTDYVDLDSLLIGYLIQEITSNNDGQWTSFYLWKDSDKSGDGKIHYGPVWDFDLAYYNYSHAVEDFTGMWTGADGKGQKFYTGRADNLYVMHQAVSGYGNGGQENTANLGWLGTLYLKETDRISELYYGKFDQYLKDLSEKDSDGSSQISAVADTIRPSAEMNLIRWHMFGKGAPYKQLGPNTGTTYSDHIEWVRSWVERRRTYLRSEWLPHMAELAAEGLPAQKNSLALTEYDEDGLEQLDMIILAGQAAVRAAKELEGVQNACASVAEKLLDVPRREITGDFTDDKTVDVKDAQALLKYYAKTLVENVTDMPNATQLRNGDVDHNGRIDAIDALHILRYNTMQLLGEEYAFPKAANTAE